MASKARKSLEENLADVNRLLEFHTAEGGNAKGRRFGLEVLNKSAIVLITAYWEAYCEDIAAEGLDHMVAYLNEAKNLPKEIRKIIAAELKADKNELAVWRLSGDGWRKVLVERMKKLTEDRNRKLNTPKSSQVDELFRTAIGIGRISNAWHWDRTTADNARTKLDKYISLRGEIAHRGRPDDSVRKSQVVGYLSLVKNLAARTGGHVNRHVKRVTGNTLW